MGETAKASGRVNKIGNFFVDKIDDAKMREYIGTAGVEIEDAEGMSAEQLGVALTLHFQGVADRDDLCKCAECGGEAPETVSPCPFCGLDGEVSDPDAAPDSAPPDAPPDAPVEAEGVEVIDDRPAKGKKDKATTKAKKNGKAATAMTTTGTNGITHLKGKGTSLSTAHTEKDLDKAIGEVYALKTGAVHSFLDLGKKILEINEKQLWRLRVDDKGKARYSGFDAFVTHELAMTPGQAYDLMRQVQEYTPEDIVRLGRSKISLLLKAPPDFREELKKEVEKGMPKRKLAEKVKEARKKTGYEGDNQQSKAGAAGGRAKAKKHATAVRQEKITIAQIEGRKTVKLFAKPASLRNVDLSTCKRAKAIGDQPFGQLALTNEVVMNITIQKTDAGLVAVIDTRRDTSEA